MTKEEFAKQAAAECCSEETTAHHGGPAGRTFWNPEAIQFMYAPAFQFQKLPSIYKYLYTATDEQGGVHTFECDNTHALLTPIWAEIPEGVVELTVHAVDDDGNKLHLVGARTFFKLASFPADLPPAKCKYGEAAAKAFDYAMTQNFINHWLTDGTPDPDYDLYVYPSKMISSVINAMVDYAKVCPDKAETAMKVARASADYLIGITPKEGVMEGVPPTYQLDFRPNPETRSNASATDRIDWVMMIYPAHVGKSYLRLEKATGDAKYLDAARKIAEHYRANVQENGTWYLIRNIHNGELIGNDFCDPLERIVPFLMMFYERTGEEIWKTLADGAIRYVEKTVLASYEWGAQFEDSFCSVNYSNLTHYGADALVQYYAKYFSHDEEKMKIADDLMRFIEDQFVVWKRMSPWNKNHFDTSVYHTPCGLEQYLWYVPIDASTGDIIETFLAMYKAGRGELHLEKAKALGDSITNVQQENGLIPTHWYNPDDLVNGGGFWINCMFMSANALTELSETLEK